jgi:SAM-dependent methyltransferase
VPIPRRFSVLWHTVDGALRYHRVLDELEDVWRDDLRVLEVGSGSGGVAAYVNHPIVGVDTRFDRTALNVQPNLEPVEASATALPFDDASMDVVLSLEMLEHLPAPDRRRVLAELYRVCVPGGRVVLTFPSGEGARVLDRWLNDSFRARNGIDHPWVIEHLEEGVPDRGEVERELTALGADVRVGRHYSVPAFVLVQGLYSLRWGGLAFGWLLRSRPVATLVFRLVKRDRAPAAYRAVVVAEKPG